MYSMVITGPESSGKTQLAQALADRLRVGWLPEFSRSFLERLGRNYVQRDLLTIASGQWLWQKHARSQAAPYLVCDTDLQVMDIWHQVKYAAPDPAISAWRSHWTPDLYVLCSPDFPWEEDPLREHPELREMLFERYLEDLQRRALKHVIVAGPLENRIARVLEAMNEDGAYPPAGNAK